MADHYKVELGQAIKRRRLELGLTQKELADLTHYKEAQSVSRWERGENAPGDLEIVADALDWTLADLVAGIRPPSTRMARRFGTAADSEPSQLDRIEAQIREIRALLLGEAPEGDGELVAGIADRILSADESPHTQDDGRTRSPAASRQRKSA